MASFRPHPALAAVFGMLALMSAFHVLAALLFGDGIRELGVSPLVYGAIVAGIGAASALVATAFRGGAPWLRGALRLWGAIVALSGMALLIHALSMGLPIPTVVAGFALLVMLAFYSGRLAEKARVLDR